MFCSLLAAAYCIHCMLCSSLLLHAVFSLFLCAFLFWLLQLVHAVDTTSLSAACCSHKFAFRSKMKDAIGVHDLTLSRGSSAGPGLLSKSAAASRQTSKHTPSLVGLLFFGFLLSFFFHLACTRSISHAFCLSLSLLHTCVLAEQLASLLCILLVLVLVKVERISQYARCCMKPGGTTFKICM